MHQISYYSTLETSIDSYYTCLLYITDYLEVTDSMLQSLMMRHRTLSDTNCTLVENLGTMADQVLHQQIDECVLIASSFFLFVIINSDIAI